MATIPHFRLLRSSAICGALCLGLAVNAQTGTGTGTGAGAGTATGGAPASTERARAKDQLPRADVAFMKQAAENGHAEVESSQLALSKATDAQV